MCDERTGAGIIAANITSTEDSILIFFQSDGSYEKKGFVIRYTENYVSNATTSTASVTSTSTVATSTGGSGVTFQSIQTETSKFVVCLCGLLQLVHYIYIVMFE